MILAKVLGCVIATQKHKSLNARSIFVVQPVDKEGVAHGDSFLALDTVSAGPGDLVFICTEGSGCRDMLQDKSAPVNSVIAGIVDAS